MNNHLSLTDVLSRLWNVEKEERLKVTLLGIGPMSGHIITAIFELARDENFPVIFTASRNQVDTEALGGGYVLGWDQNKFRKAIDGYAEKAGFKGLLFLCRDHGGPWHRDKEKSEMLSEKEAMDRAKASYLADILAGFDLLHIDPTVDPHVKGYVPLETVIKRTIELIAYIEKERERRGIKRISYEVGTEETAGGTTDFKAFEQFLIDLISGAEKGGLPKPDFIVGQTGTLLKMRGNVGNFNHEKSKELAGIARRYGVGFKEHNADFLDSKILSAHPSLGITASNIGPEFSIAETDAYLKLAGIEEEAVRGKKSADPSDFIAVIQKAAIKSGRWKKWLPKNKSHFTEREITQDMEILNEIVSVCGRYVNDEVEVREARKKLFDNLKKTGVVHDPDREIIESIRKSIKRCTDAFNLKGITSKIVK